MLSKATLAAMCILVAMSCGSQAAIVYQHTYGLGETGSIVGGNRPQDGTGTSNFGNGWSGAIGIGTAAVAAPGSTAYGIFTKSGAYNAQFNAFATNNFAVEVWVRTSNTGQSNNQFFRTGGSGLIFHVVNGNWGAAIGGNWVGGSNGAGQAIVSGQWTHLAMIRDSGTSMFYIDGAPQSGTQTVAPTHGSGQGHIGVQSGGGRWYVGDMDELRMFTFDPITDDPVAALNLPDPLLSVSPTLLDFGDVITGATVSAQNIGVSESNGGPGTYQIGIAPYGFLAADAGTSQSIAARATNSHSVSLDTSTVGAFSGNLNFSSTDPDPDLNQDVALPATVLDHSNASFSGTSDLPSLLIDFGILDFGPGTATRPFDISNFGTTLTADLDLLNIAVAGDSGQLYADLALFSGLAGGASNSYTATLDLGTVGAFETIYTLTLQDENLPGQGGTQTLTLTLRAILVPEPTTILVWSLLAGLGVGLRWRRRK